MAAPAVAPPPSFDSGHLLSLCSGLGGVRELPGGAGTAYVRDDDALECLVDIQRFLRRDEPTQRAVVCQLAEWNTLRGHIVPLMCAYSSNFDLLFNATKARASRACSAPPALCFGVHARLSRPHTRAICAVGRAMRRGGGR